MKNPLNLILILSVITVAGCADAPSDKDATKNFWKQRVPFGATNVEVVDSQSCEFDFRGKHYLQMGYYDSRTIIEVNRLSEDGEKK